MFTNTVGQWVNLCERKRKLVCEREEEEKMDPKPHAICIPYPAQSHIKAMLKLAELLHNKGIHITFINTEYNHNRFLASRGPNSLSGLPDFWFETISDGLQQEVGNVTQDLAVLCDAARTNFLGPFVNLVGKLNAGGGPPVTCVVSDGFMPFTVDAAQRLGIPVALLWTLAACGFMGFFQIHKLMDKGLIPLKGKQTCLYWFLDIWLILQLKFFSHNSKSFKIYC